MKTNPCRKSIIMALLLMIWTVKANADFHLWILNEIYSNSDGSVQYIELTTASGGQHVLAGHSLVSQDSVSGATTFIFSQNLPGSDTANRSFLLATERFQSLTGMEADYTIPASFISTTSGSLNFGEGTDTLQYTLGTLPLNGIQAMSRNFQPVIPSPQNFDGLSATITVAPLATYDAGSGVMNVPILTAPGIGTGNVSFLVNLTADLSQTTFTLQDYYLYASNIAGSEDAAQFQNNEVLHVPGLLLGNEIYEFNLTILGDNPVVFGNPEIISVVPAMNQPPQNQPSDNDPGNPQVPDDVDPEY